MLGRLLRKEVPIAEVAASIYFYFSKFAFKIA